MSRLPPQPTDTALARFVQRIVDSTPWGKLTKARATIARKDAHIQTLIHEAYLLRRDYQSLFKPPIQNACQPTPEEVGLRIERSDARMELITRIQVSYRTLTYNVAFGAYAMRHVEISELGAEALRRAAAEIAHEHIGAHRDNLIRLALRGRTIEELVKA